MNDKFYIKKLFNYKSIIVTKFRNKKKFFLAKLRKISKIVISQITGIFISFVSSQEGRELYNFNQINAGKNLFFMKGLDYVNRYTYRIFLKFDLIFLSFYLFNLELFVLKLLIFGKKYDKAISYSNKLFLKYPNFSPIIDDYYIFILKKHTYSIKKSIRYFLKLNGLKKGVIYIVDSHSAKGPTSLIYSYLNKFKGIRSLGIEFDIENLKLINDISNQYDTINLHLTSIFNNQKNINGEIFNQLKRYKHKGFKINLWINEYHQFRKYKKLRGILELVENFYVFNQNIKDNLIKFSKIKKDRIIVMDIINYFGLINTSKKNNIYYKNKLLFPSVKYSLHITSLQSLESYKFIRDIIIKNKESKLFTDSHKLIIILNKENTNIFRNRARVKNLYKLLKTEKNILILKEKFFGWFETNYYYSVFNNIDNFIMFDNNIFYHEYIVLANTMKFNIFYKEEFASDLYSYDYKYLFKNYNELFERIKNTRKITLNSSYKNSYYNKETINKFFKNKEFKTIDENNLSKPKDIKYNFNLVILRIIGNDLPPLHTSNQSIFNIEYIINNEELPNSSKRVWILNRLINNEKKDQIIKLLDKNNESYKIINYENKKLLDIGLENFEHSRNIFNREIFFFLKNKNKFFNKILINFNKYIMNNNGARNFALEIGKKEKGKWILPLDGNIFITKNDYKKIENDIESDDFNFLIMPMARINDFKELNNKDSLNFVEEPQIGFKYESNLKYNENYVYGSRPKVELLQKLQILGRWGSVRTMVPNHLEEFFIDSSHYYDYKFTGGVIRLPASHTSKNFSASQLLQKRALDRDISIFQTIRENIIKEYKEKNKVSCSIYNSKNIEIIDSRYRDEIKKPFVSVINKPFPKEIKNYYSRNDYLSFAPYWWPDNSKRSGVPYIWRDGEWNPECTLYSLESQNNDRTALQILFDRLTSLALLYLKEKDISLLTYITEQISFWFLNEETKMNPHLKFAQVIRGKQKENEKGLIDFKDIYYLLSALKLIEEDFSSIENFNILDFKYWLIEYYSWLTKSNIGKKEASSVNNHATCYLLQKAAIESYLGMENKLFETLLCSFVFINNNISDNGEQKKELLRKTSKHYCCFNLQQILNINSIFINSLNMNLFKFYGTRENKILNGILWLYERKNKWHYPQIDYFDNQRFDVLFHTAIDQYEKTSNFIQKEQIRSKDEIPNNFDYRYGIPLHWKNLIHNQGKNS